ncbi:F-box domain protein [Aspergillus ibericus CBS 121593]|uniref:F-box domain-containing protein n=1 Tax=Aspergillus ibericus CBS 121593 TaxID=1448316 RepID=A0A395H5W2_9EURO|nr:hypothetical protein BO80DRAFT_492221 [Aspergillus ibericus CBS 121593]RAL03010.1 hypothetical protein BO80DRAFT_492221 [Aspergillus ibericus CBS 121593]
MPSHEKTDLYLFHDLCWHRLWQHFSPEEVPLICLYEALECLPFPVGGRLWPARELPTSPECLPWYHPHEHDRTVRNGHFGLPSLDELMRFAKNPPTPLATTTNQPTLPPPRMNHRQRLPLEIIEMIGTLLPTRDMLHLRQASRAATPLFSSLPFWRSRFTINGDRGFLLPVIEQLTPPRRQSLDWRLLYHSTCKLTCSRWFQFEIHAWEALRWLRDTAVAIHRGRTPPLAFRGNALHHYHHTTYRDMHLESVNLGPSLRQIAISVLQDIGEVYITGMEFIFDDRPPAMLGYTTPGAKPATVDTYANGYDAQADWPYPGIRVVWEIRTRLRGIAVHRGLDCVRGVSIIQDGMPGREQDYVYSVGCFVRVTVREAEWFLALEEVRRVVAVFDSRKMIDIGVLGVGRRRVEEQTREKWERLIHVFRRNGTVPASLEFR